MVNKGLIKTVHVPRINDDGFLFFAQHPDHVPFKIKRIYYITSPVKGLPRGKHVHKRTRQMLFCIRGSVRMVLDDGKNRQTKTLSNPETGILLDRLMWHEMQDMDENTILLVLASEKFDPKDYIRDYDKFLSLAKSRKK